jgi:ArsR family transcriptional regulator
MNDITNLPAICITALEEHLRPELFKSLCDPTRLSIVAYLATQNSPVRVGSLAKLYGIDFSGVSRHLKMLKEADVVTATKQGREVMYSLNSQDLIQTLRGFADAVEACCRDID